MKNNKGMGIISLICIVIVIAIIAGTAVYFVRLKYNEARIETIKTDMLLVEWKLKSYVDSQTADKVENINYLGKKLQDMQNDEIVKNFLEKDILTEEEKEKYYVLSDKDLAEAKLEITSPEGNYYLIDYNSYEIILTGGCKISDSKILYKLSDIEKETSKSVKNEENNTENNEMSEVE